MGEALREDERKRRYVTNLQGEEGTEDTLRKGKAEEKLHLWEKRERDKVLH